MSAATDTGVVAVMDVAAAWAQQVADRGGIPQRVREAASGIAYQQGLARAAVGDLIAEREAAVAALADALGWIADMRCNDKTTHPRLKVLRAALARAGGGK